MNRFDLLKWSPTLSRWAYNKLYARIAAKQYKENKEILRQLEQFRNIHKGKRCFIIGTGPSLKISDLEILSNEITFAPNRIYELFDKTIWRPTYYICQDHELIQNFAEQIKNVEASICFVPANYKDIFIGNKFRFFVIREREFYPHNAEFSFDISRYISQGYTVTYGAIQMAIYMGFDEIYLIGIDHNYNITRDSKGRIVRSNDDKSNYPDGMREYTSMKNLPRVEETTIAYDTAELISRKLGVRIYNCTRGGRLEAFERKELESVIN